MTAPTKQAQRLGPLSYEAGLAAQLRHERTIADLIAALRAYANQAESVAGLASCGEVKFLTGLAKAMRTTADRAEE